MSATGKSATRLVGTLSALAGLLWLIHASAWDLGGRSPVLNYDSAQYALAARELADHGRLATTFALPIELARHPDPPWPLAVVQPGLVAVEAALFKLASPGAAGRTPGGDAPGGHDAIQSPEGRGWLALVAPIGCYFALGAALALATARILARFASLSDRDRTAAGFVVGLAFLLDPEAQHFAAGGFSELPFTLLLALALAALALEAAPARPLIFGLLLGVAGSFRANMLWLAPVLCLAAAATAPRGRRLRVALTAYAGYLIPAAPWWIYKWRAFGTPAWDLTRFVVWDGIGGRSWSSIYDQPDPPSLPAGIEAARLLAHKVWGNLGPLLLAVLTGPRALWLGTLVAWLATARGPRPLVVAGLAALAAFGLGVLAAAVSIPWLRYVFPARVLLEAAGLLALWGLAARWAGAQETTPPAVQPAAAAAPAVAPPAPACVPGSRAPRALAVGAAVLALAWGALSTARGDLEAQERSRVRDLPGTATLLAVSSMLAAELPADVPVMSNLGPVLAWHARRPVVHLPLSPADLDACRRKLEVGHVILVYRDPGRAAPGWNSIFARPGEAAHDPDLGIRRARLWRSEDGFSVVWLELLSLKPRLASGGPSPAVSARPIPLQAATGSTPRQLE